jgi:hypothetical protein
MYDCYVNGYYQFCKSSDLKNFTYVQDTRTRGNFTPRHGSVIHITAAERERLESWSALGEAMRELYHIAVPCYTLDELEERKSLQVYVDKVQAGDCNKKAYQKALKKIAKFKAKVLK